MDVGALREVPSEPSPPRGDFFLPMDMSLSRKSLSSVSEWDAFIRMSRFHGNRSRPPMTFFAIFLKALRPKPFFFLGFASSSA